VHRFYLPPNQCAGNALVLRGREAHHGLHVLRLGKGDTAVVLDGAGQELLCEVTNVAREAISLSIQQRSSIPPLPYQLTLAQGIPKGKLFDSIIQKTTELGVHRIVPLLCERVIRRLNEESADKMLDHWRLVAIEAIKQCGSTWLPRIEMPVAPLAFVSNYGTFDLSLVASLQPGSRHPRACFTAFREQHGQMPRSLCVWVGPEGDFTAAEIQAAQSAGALPITLGRLVLRSETAAVYCLSVLNYELQAHLP
jgi:16S rRNA (uracil1498-N3)-methyltransferase